MLPRSTALLQYLKNFSRTEQRVDMLIECPIPSWKALDQHKGLLLVSALIDTLKLTLQEATCIISYCFFCTINGWLDR